MLKKTIIGKWLIAPINNFISNSKTAGILLFCSAFAAIVIANSPFAATFHHLWEIDFSVGFNGVIINKSLHHWINDGLMAIFFFVVGLELKREILVGDLKEVKNAVLPITTAIFGMLFPAIIFIAFNYHNSIDGWGIPMATDIAFALGILYLLGDKVPISLKVFLTAIAIVDDLGAVLVIAFFYTSQIDFTSLVVGGGFLAILVSANLLGVRNTIFYGVIGIGGVWLAFLMSGIHATIAAVLAAFTIPANTKINDQLFKHQLDILFSKYKKAKTNNIDMVTHEQQVVLEKIKFISKETIPPLQRLEHMLHPFVAFIILPVFALSNAGVEFSENLWNDLFSPIALGIFVGLLVGKVLGIYGITYLLVKFKWAKLPEGVTLKHILGIGFLGAIGFTMSLFVAELAYKDVEAIAQAKVGILFASITASFVGYWIISRQTK